MPRSCRGSPARRASGKSARLTPRASGHATSDACAPRSERPLTLLLGAAQLVGDPPAHELLEARVLEPLHDLLEVALDEHPHGLGARDAAGHHVEDLLLVELAHGAAVGGGDVVGLRRSATGSRRSWPWATAASSASGGRCGTPARPGRSRSGPRRRTRDSPVSAPFQTVSPVVWPASCLSVVKRSRCSSRSVKYMPVWRMSEPGSAVMMSRRCLSANAFTTGSRAARARKSGRSLGPSTLTPCRARNRDNVTCRAYACTAGRDPSADREGLL